LPPPGLRLGASLMGACMWPACVAQISKPGKQSMANDDGWQWRKWVLDGAGMAFVRVSAWLWHAARPAGFMGWGRPRIARFVARQATSRRRQQQPRPFRSGAQGTLRALACSARRCARKATRAQLAGRQERAEQHARWRPMRQQTRPCASAIHAQRVWSSLHCCWCMGAPVAWRYDVQLQRRSASTAQGCRRASAWLQLWTSAGI
jgi:hypothetical protein